jgi:hypothetical protein
MINARLGTRGIIVSIEILNLKNFKNSGSDKGIDVAFPVLAIECEVSVPVEKEIDAYQEAVLKLILIGLTKNNIQKTLNITESLCGSILANLEIHNYIEDTSNRYTLTPKAHNYLNGLEIIDPDTESKFGYILTSAIKKEPLWYFHEGDIFNIPRSDSKLVENKLTIENTEDITFESADVPGWRLEKAFSLYCRIIKIWEKNNKNDVPDEDIMDSFAGIEADLSEANYQDDSKELANEGKKNAISRNLKVRKLNRKPKKLYLQMRIVIDPSIPGGFSVESPFDLDGYDNELFLRQIQWIMNPVHNVFIGKDKFSEFMLKEINKLLPKNRMNTDKVDKDVYIRKNLPILYTEQDKYINVFEDTGMIIDLIQQKNLSLLVKENIVNSFNRKLVECLMERLFRTVSEENRKKINTQAYKDFTSIGNDKTTMQNERIEQFAKVIGVDRNVLPQNTGVVYSAIKRLKHTNGNSIYEKLLNLIVYQYYQPSPQIRKFFQIEGIGDYIKIVYNLNDIRNSASHSTNRHFTEQGYDYYIDHIFDVANRLLESLKEEV